MKETKCFYDFESFRIDTLKRQLLRDEEVLPLTSKAYAALLILVQRQGETVTKEELMSAIWFDTQVEENNLTQQISTLRKTLGEQPRAPQFIITIPGQGYSFIAPVRESLYTEQENDSQKTETGANKLPNAPNFPWTVRSVGQKAFIFLSLVGALYVFFFPALINFRQSSVCILPFRSLDNNEKSNLYSEGIPSYVTAKIGNLPNMIVRPVNSSEKYYGQEQNVVAAGRDHNADVVLTGSTLCEGESVQVIVHLWDVKNNRQIWAKVFTKNASSAINVQETISEEIVSVLRAELAN